MAVFTSNQCRAIDSDSDRLLLLAAAGSGKSTTLVERIAVMASDEKVKPENILCITFTRKAAEEFKVKLGNRIGSKAEKITVNTFHGTAYSMLCKAEHTNYSIVSQEEVEGTIKEIAETCGFRKESMKTWMTMKNLYCQGREKEMSPNGKKVISELYSRMLGCRAIDFDYILPRLMNLAESSASVKSYIRNRFRYVFVDEYQDTDDIQERFLAMLEPEKLTCVGDADQSIYSFRNANVKIISDMSKRPDVEVVMLDDCFRCKPNIVEKANNLIKNNTDRPDMTMHSAVIGGKGIVVHSETEFDKSADRVASIINELHDEAGLEYGDIAVIARTHRSLDRISDEILAKYENIPLINVGNKSGEVFESRFFNGLMSMLRIMLNPDDEFAFSTFGDIVLGMDSTGRRMAVAKRKISRESLIPSEIYDKAKAMKWSELCRYYRSLYEGNPHNAFELSEEDMETIYDYCGNRDAELQEVADYHISKDFQSDLEEQVDAVTFITSHASKGLEWGAVIVADFDDGIFPSRRSVSENNLEEERRLAYVTFTRAKDQLFVLSTRGKKSVFAREAGL